MNRPPAVRRGLALVAATLLAAAPCATGVAQARPADAGTPTSRAAVADTTNWGDVQHPTLTGSSRTFTFATSKAVTARFVIGDLATNYDLKLTTAAGKLLRSSAHAGVRFEEIVTPLPAGTYKIVVTGAGAPSSPAFYLRGVRYTKPAILSQRTLLSDDRERFTAIEFLNPTNLPVTLEANLKRYDAQGGYLGVDKIVTIRMAQPGRKGIAVTSAGRKYAPEDSSFKLVDVRFTGTRSCPVNTSYRGAISNGKITFRAEHATGDRYVFSGLVRVKVPGVHVLTAAELDRRGDILDAGHVTLDRISSKEPVSYRDEVFFNRNGAVPAWDVAITRGYHC
ncbi:MAG: hypothetical protein JWQ74_2100 [Marmoricola sp.]|nr:hypothetical protein [Marmoricola sp.]